MTHMAWGHTGGDTGRLAVLAAIGLALSGCAYSMSEFARTDPTPTGSPTVLTGTVNEPPAEIATAKPAPAAKPIALVEEPPSATTRLDAAVVATGTPPPATEGYPNFNQTPPRQNSKLLSPEEKAKVIAELEALAKAQGAPVAKARQAARAECDAEAAKTLDPEERIKREREGLTC